jgi:hypothetical protein
MENFPKKRGRPRKIPESLAGSFGLAPPPDIPEPVREMFESRVRTERTRANRYYADGAREVVEELSKQARRPDDPVLAAKLRLGMDWILARKTVLTELGRMMQEEPTERDIERFQDTVMGVAERHDKLTAKTAVARIRRARLGETERRERVADLHHDLNAAINLHRQRFPESTWADVRRALELTAGQIERKMGKLSRS